MKLIVGLGNPGKKYQDTWHNLGFLAVDKFLEKHGTKKFFNSTHFKMSKFKAEIAEIKIDQEKIILAKPQTFMNESGQAVSLLSNFYKIKPENITVVHDDIDILLGEVKTAFNSSSAGHKGVQSIIDQLGTQKFHRLRIGIKSEKQGQIPTEKYVLQKIDKEDTIVINKSVQQAIEAVDKLI